MRAKKTNVNENANENVNENVNATHAMQCKCYQLYPTSFPSLPFRSCSVTRYDKTQIKLHVTEKYKKTT